MTVSPAFPAAHPGRSALAKASWRLLPLLGLGYCIALASHDCIALESQLADELWTFPIDDDIGAY